MEKGPKGGFEIYKSRRKKLLELIKDGIAILPAHPEQIRNNDVHHKYRQDSCFYYLSGFTEPESVLFFDPASQAPFKMFVRERDPAKELWDGFRYGVEGAGKYFGADHVYPISAFAEMLPDLVKGADKIYYRVNEDKEFDETVLAGVEKGRKSRGRTGLGSPTFTDIKQVVGEMRLIKSKEEVGFLRQACEISSHGHLAAMRFCKPGLHEYEIEAEIEREFRRRGSERLGYSSIVGTGSNATVLHYIFNDDVCKKDDMLLIDAGAEYGYFSGDITRTFPVGGKFSPAQKKIYEGVLRLQKDCIAFVKPGIKFAEIHQRAVDGLTDVMLELGLLKGNKKQIIEGKEYLRYFPHGTGHWLGMDVHDSGLYSKSGEGRKLEPSMVFTVEPGLYVPENDKNAPAEFRGIGVRIEDDVVVTSSGCEVLTSLAPKEIDQIENLVGRG